MINSMVFGIILSASSWLGWLERCLRVCVVLNVPGSSSGLTTNFLSVHFTSHCIGSLPYYVSQFSAQSICGPSKVKKVFQNCEKGKKSKRPQSSQSSCTQFWGCVETVNKPALCMFLVENRKSWYIPWSSHCLTE